MAKRVFDYYVTARVISDKPRGVYNYRVIIRGFKDIQKVDDMLDLEDRVRKSIERSEKIGVGLALIQYTQKFERLIKDTEPEEDKEDKVIEFKAKVA